MYNQGNMRLHVDVFIKYVSNNVYSDNNHGQPQSILNIFLTFFSSLYFITIFCGLFSVWYWYHWFFFWAGWKWVGRRDCLRNKYKKLPRREPKCGRSGRWEKKYGHPYNDQIYKTRQYVPRYAIYISKMFSHQCCIANNIYTLQILHLIVNLRGDII